MKSHDIGIQSNPDRASVSAQARLLMSLNRQKQHNRQQSMLQRAASAAGMDG
jgi:hypothetical protein